MVLWFYGFMFFLAFRQGLSGYSFLTLVKTNKSIFTTRELERADKSIELHQKLGSPGYEYKQFFRILEGEGR